jgi:hypothetical protein
MLIPPPSVWGMVDPLLATPLLSDVTSAAELPHSNSAYLFGFPSPLQVRWLPVFRLFCFFSRPHCAVVLVRPYGRRMPPLTSVGTAVGIVRAEIPPTREYRRRGPLLTHLKPSYCRRSRWFPPKLLLCSQSKADAMSSLVSLLPTVPSPAVRPAPSNLPTASMMLDAVADFVEERCERNTRKYDAPGDRHTPFAPPPHTQLSRKSSIHYAVADSSTSSLSSPVDAAPSQAGEATAHRRLCPSPLQGSPEAFTTEPVTSFHSRDVPSVSLRHLALVIRRNAGVNAESLILAFILFARYEKESGLLVTAHMMHRLFAACAQVATKAHCDVFCNNHVFAGVVGVPLWELNRLEAELLVRLRWHVVVSGIARHHVLSVGGAALYDDLVHHRLGDIDWAASAAHPCWAGSVSAYLAASCSQLSNSANGGFDPLLTHHPAVCGPPAPPAGGAVPNSDPDHHQRIQSVAANLDGLRSVSTGSPVSVSGD